MRYRLILKEGFIARGLYWLLPKDPELIDVVDSIPNNEYRSDIVLGATALEKLAAKKIIKYRIKDRCVGFVCLEGQGFSTLNLAIAVHKDFWGKGISKKLVKSAIKWSKENGYKKLIWMCHTKNKRSLGLALHFGFKPSLINNSWMTILSLDLTKKSKLREDLGNTPKGYKDINHIIEVCNEWFENNPDKADKIIWKRHIQIRNWSKELKKYRSKFGPITYERDLKNIKLNTKRQGKDGYTTIDRAIKIAFKNWKDNKYNMEDINRELMYCLIELKNYRKKFKKQEFSCKL